MGRTKSLLLFARNLDEWLFAIFTYVVVRLLVRRCLYAAAMTDRFYGIG